MALPLAQAVNPPELGCVRRRHTLLAAAITACQARGVRPCLAAEAEPSVHALPRVLQASAAECDYNFAPRDALDQRAAASRAAWHSPVVQDRWAESRGGLHGAAVASSAPAAAAYDQYAGSYDVLDGSAAADGLGFPELRRALLARASGDVLEVGPPLVCTCCAACTPTHPVPSYLAGTHGLPEPLAAHGPKLITQADPLPHTHQDTCNSWQRMCAAPDRHNSMRDAAGWHARWGRRSGPSSRRPPPPAWLRHPASQTQCPHS